MGIDVYLEWDDMTEEEKKGQYTGFDAWKGDAGYLREAYHGGPYATKVLISEDWNTQPENGFVISNAELMERLKDVLNASHERSITIYEDSEGYDLFRTMKSFYDFVMLHKKMESEGRHPRIIVSY